MSNTILSVEVSNLATPILSVQISDYTSFITEQDLIDAILAHNISNISHEDIRQLITTLSGNVYSSLSLSTTNLLNIINSLSGNTYTDIQTLSGDIYSLQLNFANYAHLSGANFYGDIFATNLTGTNTGDQDLSSYATTSSLTSSYVPYSGATQGLDLGSHSLCVNAPVNIGNIINGFTTIQYNRINSDTDPLVETGIPLILNNSGGNVLIGTTVDIGCKLHVQGEGGIVVGEQAGYGQISADSGDSTIPLVLQNPNGNVLIGTVDDDTVNKLQVNGSIIASNLSGVNTGDQDLSSYATSSSLTAYVPYTGATQNVNLGISNSLIVGDESLQNNGVILNGQNCVLDVKGSTCLNGDVTVPNGTVILGNNGSDGSNAELQVKAQVGSSAPAASFQNGNVLIGTVYDDTVNKLQVNGSIIASNLSGVNTGDQDLSSYALQTFVTSSISDHNTSSIAHSGIRQDITNVSNSLSAYALSSAVNNLSNSLSSYALQSFVTSSISSHNVAIDSHQDIRDNVTNVSNSLSSYATLSGANFTGNITASNLSGVNTGDQDLSSYATSSALTANYVPYIGANQGLDLGIYDLSASNLEDYKNYSGFENRIDSSLSIDASGVITLSGTSFNVWTNGTGKHTLSGTHTVTVTADQTISYVYVNSSGVLSIMTSPWELASGENAVCAIVFKDANTYALTDERHSYERNKSWHKWAHFNIGAMYYSGFTGVFTTTTLSVTQGVIYDEDILFDSLTTKTSTTLWYRNATSGMRIVRNATSCKASVGGALAYDDGSGTLQPVTNNRYATNWVYASNDPIEPIYTVVGQGNYTNVTNARNAASPTINLSTAEWKLIYRVIYQRTSGTPLGQYVEAADYRRVTTGVPTNAISTDHSSLINRDAANSHPAAAISFESTTVNDVLSGGYTHPKKIVLMDADGDSIELNLVNGILKL